MACFQRGMVVNNICITNFAFSSDTSVQLLQVDFSRYLVELLQVDCFLTDQLRYCKQILKACKERQGMMAKVAQGGILFGLQDCF